MNTFLLTARPGLTDISCFLIREAWDMWFSSFVFKSIFSSLNGVWIRSYESPKSGSPPTGEFSVSQADFTQDPVRACRDGSGPARPHRNLPTPTFRCILGNPGPVNLFLYELRTHPSFYLDMTIAGALILGALGFYIGAAKGWLPQQREELKETHDFYRAKIEEEVLRAKKLEAVSRLAGGIAHDFNNVLTMFLGNLALAKLSSGLEKETEDRITAAENAILSAKTITQQLLTFSKGGAPSKRPSREPVHPRSRRVFRAKLQAAARRFSRLSA